VQADNKNMESINFDKEAQIIRMDRATEPWFNEPTPQPVKDDEPTDHLSIITSEKPPDPPFVPRPQEGTKPNPYIFLEQDAA
jgi:hypothetical protein